MFMKCPNSTSFVLYSLSVENLRAMLEDGPHQKITRSQYMIRLTKQKHLLFINLKFVYFTGVSLPLRPNNKDSL